MNRFFGPPLTSIPIQSSLPMHAFSQAPFMYPGAGFTIPPSMPGVGGPALGSWGGGGALSSIARTGAQAQRGGGLLARLFGGGRGLSGAGNIASTLGKTGGSSFNLTTILDHSQRVLGLTQQVVPMVKQYGPIVRNLPTLWRMMRSSDEATTFAGVDLDGFSFQGDSVENNHDTNPENSTASFDDTQNYTQNHSSEAESFSEATLNQVNFVEDVNQSKAPVSSNERPFDSKYSHSIEPNMPVPKLYI
ncbi:hypothetical protein BTS2_2835 [Bacillus sp. TS-2]|nr:hypothetical protein BTS2_2835 [Bacillus sp. TS-2]